MPRFYLLWNLLASWEISELGFWWLAIIWTVWQPSAQLWFSHASVFGLKTGLAVVNEIPVYSASCTHLVSLTSNRWKVNELSVVSVVVTNDYWSHTCRSNQSVADPDIPPCGVYLICVLVSHVDFSLEGAKACRKTGWEAMVGFAPLDPPLEPVI